MHTVTALQGYTLHNDHAYFPSELNNDLAYFSKGLHSDHASLHTFPQVYTLSMHNLR